MTKKFLAALLSLAMIVSTIPTAVFAASSPIVPTADSDVMSNTNQKDGVILTKGAEVKEDGTIDITIEAMTTGQVISSVTTAPADIVLVLDMSGSMNDNLTSVSYSYEKAFASNTGFIFDRYGFFGRFENTQSRTYYILSGDEYIPLTFGGVDDDNYEYYTYYSGSQLVTVYPKMSESDANKVQFYAHQRNTTSVSKISLLRSAVNEFLATTEQHNGSIDSEFKKHRVSLVKYASDSYASSNLLEEGNDRMGGSNNYNYSQLVKNLTSDIGSLKTYFDGINTSTNDELVPSGATAVDYGVNIADAVLERALTDTSYYQNTGRQQIMIVFTDGTPTHSSSFEEDVANSAIEKAGVLKEIGVKVYSISVENSADSTSLTGNVNKFMHYLSSNYENAVSMSSPGTGDITKGYYQTPSDDTGLSDIFVSIAESIETPHISLGSETKIVDSLSNHFVINGTTPTDTSSITVETSDADMSGGNITWSNPVPATGVTVDVRNQNTVTVTGFDFDANFISTEPRTQGTNTSFYGRKLIIRINALPDYEEIDASVASGNVQGGVLETNHLTANIYDESSNVVAAVDSPKVNINKVTYTVDGAPYSQEYWRFPNASVSYISAPKKLGHTFSGWSIVSPANISVSGDTFTMPASDVVIEGRFTANTHSVSYEYSNPPAGAPQIPGETTLTNVSYGTSVDVATWKPTLPGYTFKGWYVKSPAELSINGGSFSMPDEDVVLYGYFDVNTDTPYYIQHYYEKADKSGYILDDTKTEEHAGTTGHTATVNVDSAKLEPGFALNTALNSEWSGTITAEPSLVLKMYYDRQAYDVEYAYDGTQPAGAPGLPAKVEDITYGTEVDIADDLTFAGYTFDGWYTKDDNGTLVDGDMDSFAMPARNVTLYGKFIANNNTKYEIHHYYQEFNEVTQSTEYPSTPNVEQTAAATTGTTVSVNYLDANGATPYILEKDGYSLDSQCDDAVYEGTVAGDGSLVLKVYYKLDKFKVTYKLNSNPNNEATAPAEATYYYSQTVEVEDDLAISGYTFVGWRDYDNGSVAGYETVSFKMPARDVVLQGRFEANTDTQYKIEHYLQDLSSVGTPDNKTYTIDNTRTDILTGVTGATVSTTDYIDTVEGYKHNGDIDSGIILGDNSLVLKVYYDLEQYSLTYEYYSDASHPIPTDADPVPAVEKYYYGEDVLVAPKPFVEGYTFEGWRDSAESPVVIGTTASFKMPARDVIVRGRFTPNTNTHYKVEYYFQNIENDDYTIDNDKTIVAYGTTGATVDAQSKGYITDFEGFTHTVIAGQSVESGEISGDGSLTLKIYYSRNSYTLKYTYKNNPVPAGATALVAATTRKYGERIEIAPLATAPSHKFHGWYDTATTAPLNILGHLYFYMPARDVTLEGEFTELEKGQYKVEYYLQNPDNTTEYVLESDHLHTHTVEFDANNTPIDVSVTTYPTFTGYFFDTNHSGNVIDGTVTVDGETVVLKAYYSLTPYTITYEYEGTQPAGAPAVHGIQTVYYNQTVTVEDDLELAGYTFNGWHSKRLTVTDDTVSFKMPAMNIVLYGNFTANTDVVYYEHHYLMDLDGKYADGGYLASLDSNYAEISKSGSDAPNKIITHNDGYTGMKTEALPLPEYIEEGFKHDDYNTWTGTVPATGTLIIRVYYTRQSEHPVKYVFTSATPAEALINNTPPVDSDTYFFGETVTVKTASDVPGYTFSGWYSPQVGTYAPGSSFEMPQIGYNSDGTSIGVVFYGTYTANPDTVYKIEHYLQQLDGRGNPGEYILDPARTDVLGGETGTEVSTEGYVDTISGYTYNPNHPDAVERGIVAGDNSLVLKIYYSLNPLPPVLPTENSIKIYKKVVAPDDFRGSNVYNFSIYYVLASGALTPVKEVSVTVNESTGIGESDTILLDHTGEYLVQEVNAGVAGYKLETTIQNDLKEIIESDEYINVSPSFTPSTVTFTNTYTKIELEIDDHFGYIIGYPDDTVRPDQNITRAEIATIFFRLLTEESRQKYWSKTNSFTDVNAGDWYNTAISTLANAGVLDGYEDNSFRPDKYITRAELVKIAMTFYGTPLAGKSDFTDTDSHWASKFIDAAAGMGFVDGYGNGVFLPDNYVTRAETMKIINRTLARAPHKDYLLDDMIVWIDNMDKNAWYYAEVQEATNSHTYHMGDVYEVWQKILPIRDWAALERD